MEVKIGVQNASRELTIDTTLDADGIEKAVTEALKDGRLTRAREDRPGNISAGD